MKSHKQVKGIFLWCRLLFLQNSSFSMWESDFDFHAHIHIPTYITEVKNAIDILRR